MSAYKGLFAKYMNPVFIETGTFHGEGVQQAIDAGFNKICSIELSLELYNYCIQRFSNDKVLLLLGDSADVLPKLLKEINEPVTFWLDGHYSGILEGEQTAGNIRSPLLQELDAIKLSSIKTHTILIDDLRGWSKESGFDVFDIMKKIKEINPDYVFILEDGFDNESKTVFKNDILIAKCL